METKVWRLTWKFTQSSKNVKGEKRNELSRIFSSFVACCRFRVCCIYVVCSRLFCWLLTATSRHLPQLSSLPLLPQWMLPMPQRPWKSSTTTMEWMRMRIELVIWHFPITHGHTAASSESRATSSSRQIFTFLYAAEVLDHRLCVPLQLRSSTSGFGIWLIDEMLSAWKIYL